MTADPVRDMARRDFLKLAGAATMCGISQNSYAASSQHVCLILDSRDPAASSEPAKRAAGQLCEAFASHGLPCAIEQSSAVAAHSSFCIVAATPQSTLAKGFASGSAITAVESLRLSPGRMDQVPAILLSARDVRGFVYGLLELAEQVRFSSNPVQTLLAIRPIEEQPANEVRGIGRYFCCELHDKPWFYEKSWWGRYLDCLVANRFNRFTLAFGLEYDFPRGVTGDYFHFVYPYMVDVPRYPDVRIMQLAAPDGSRLASPVEISKAERQRNLDMLRFIAAETGARGLHFQLGIWTHAYQWTDSPNAYHHIEGLTPENHAQYCRDALAILLKECPDIQGLTMRVHGESGIPEGSYPFWKTLFEAIANSGRQIEIDMHAKGVDQTMIDIALATGMPVKLGAKYSAEHQSLGYNQSDIRALEIPHGNLTKTESTLFSLSSGSRSFTRYGYADFLHEGAQYKLLFRLWPGTQRHLLSADPDMAAGYARTASFCGAAGLDLMEPLTFKGREGSGNPGSRCAYADASLNPQADWQKYEYYYRVWGQKLYNPDADPEVWRRYLHSEFGPAAVAAETSLAYASRILPLLTSAHLPSASNHDLWYELPSNMPIVPESEPSPYGDTPAPKCFGTVSPLDPQMFSTVDEYLKGLPTGHSSAKYSPIEVAQWIEDCVVASRDSLTEARRIGSLASPAFRRMEEDVLIQIGLGSFFAQKLRSAVLYAIYEQTGDAEAGRRALDHYRKAREGWVTMAERAGRIYLSDISYGSIPKRRGHWKDRIPAIDTDLSAMQKKLRSSPSAPDSAQSATKAIEAATGRPIRPGIRSNHTPPDAFQPGRPLSLSLAISESGRGAAPAFVRLVYRHVNQAERWTSVEMQGGSGKFIGEIPPEYTQSEYALQYYFELEDGKGSSWLHPGLDGSLSNQPYFAVFKRTA